MKNKRFLPGLLLATSLFAVSCNKPDHSDNDCPTAVQNPQPAPPTGIAAGGCIPPQDPCNTGCNGVVCTMDFASVNLRVTDSSSSPVTLDSFSVADFSNNTIQMPYGIAPGGCIEPGVYQIVNDAWVQGHQNTSTSLRVLGFKAGTLVVNETIVVGADCCHVKRVSGPESVFVSN